MNKNQELLKYYERLKQELSYDKDTGHFTWLVDKGRAKKGSRAGSETVKGYQRIRLRIDGVMKRISGHRLAWYFVYNELPKGIIDHINQDKLDNRINNLRLSDSVMNAGNVLAINKKGHKGIKLKGVNYNKCRDNWKVEITYNKKRMYLGSFEDPYEAHEVYKAKHRELFKEHSPY